MKHHTKLFILPLLLSVLSAAAANNTCPTDCDSSLVFGKTFFRARPADQNSAKEIMGVADKMHLWDEECNFYGVFSATIGYERNTNYCDLGVYFSFDSKGETRFGPDSARPTEFNNYTSVPANSSTNFRSVDLGLSPTFQSTIVWNPRIQKTLVNLDLFLGLDQFINGLWFRAYAPIIRAHYRMRPCEDVSNKGGNFFDAGFVDEISAGEVRVPYKKALDAWRRQSSFADLGASCCGRMRPPGQGVTRLGAIHLDVGYDIIRCECAHFGIGLHGVIATGNSPRASFMFPAVAGSYNNQLGVVLDESWRIWKCSEEQFVTLYGNVVISHLFSDTQSRLLGLNVGNSTVGNSWLLLKQFDDAGIYTGKVVRAANCLGRSIKVRNDFLLDGSIMLQWRRCALDLSIGYNFFYISKDKADLCPSSNAGCCKGSCYCNLDDFNYGIKGVANVERPGGTTSTFYDKNDSNIATSGTERTATTAVTNTPDAFVKESDVTECVALAPGAWSNKIFGYIGYNWECCGYKPYIGFGASYEKAEKNKLADQFGLYVKGGVQF